MKLAKKVLNYHTCFKAESDQFTKYSLYKPWPWIQNVLRMDKHFPWSVFEQQISKECRLFHVNILVAAKVILVFAVTIPRVEFKWNEWLRVLHKLMNSRLFAENSWNV